MCNQAVSPIAAELERQGVATGAARRCREGAPGAGGRRAAADSGGLFGKIAIDERQIQGGAGGDLHDPFAHVDILPVAGAQAAVDLDTRLCLTDEEILLKRRNGLIVPPLATAVDFFR